MPLHGSNLGSPAERARRSANAARAEIAVELLDEHHGRHDDDGPDLGRYHHEHLLCSACPEVAPGDGASQPGLAGAR